MKQQLAQALGDGTVIGLTVPNDKSERVPVVVTVALARRAKRD